VAAEAVGGGGAVILKGDFPREYLPEHAPRAERPAAASTLDVSRGRPKNVILVVLESVAARWLSVYGCRWDTTPLLAAEVARNAVVFENGYAHVGRTTNSLIALSLSLYPALSYRDLTADFPRLRGVSIADALREKGYRTAFVTNGDLTWAGIGDFLDGRGFETVRGFQDLGCGVELSSWGGEDRCMVEATLDFIDQEKGAPFFVMGWTDQTHHPYEPTPGVPEIDFFGEKAPEDAYDLGRYLNVLHETDKALARLFDGLRARGIADDTLVVLTGDHGEAFGEPHETWGHGFAVWQENVQVPMIVWSPRLFPAAEGGKARRDATVCAHVDVAPTIFDALGLDTPGGWVGRSFFEENRPGRAYFYAANDEYLLGVREGRWKYVLNATRGREDLFDLATDPLETFSVAPTNAEVARRLHGRVAAWAHAVRERFQGATGEVAGR
jgi:arylsulfatase A-like enzyme